VENAGGVVRLEPRADKPGKFAIVATSGRIPELTERMW
jgi:hypothetical protein